MHAERSPDPEHFAISKSHGIRIDWKDGHSSQYDLAWLRKHCPCATCTNAHGDQPPANPFQMYKPVLKIDSVEPVGNYAIQITWNDGHRTGIYSYDYLRRICPCCQG